MDENNSDRESKKEYQEKHIKGLARAKRNKNSKLNQSDAWDEKRKVPASRKLIRKM